jgi:hypothetical protein
VSRRRLPPPAGGGDLSSVLRNRYSSDQPIERERPEEDRTTGGVADVETPEHRDVTTSEAQETTTSEAQDATTSEAHDAMNSRRRAVVKPVRTGIKSSGRRDVTTSRRTERRPRPSPTAQDTVAFTVRFSGDEDAAHLQTRMAMRTVGRLKRLPDKSEVTRTLWEILGDDPELQQRVLDRLG